MERPDWIQCDYQDIRGGSHTLRCNGLLGRCMQHEVDHLNGILFTDRMKKKVFKKIQSAVIEIRAQTLQRNRSQT